MPCGIDAALMLCILMRTRQIFKCLVLTRSPQIMACYDFFISGWLRWNAPTALCPPTAAQPQEACESFSAYFITGLCYLIRHWLQGCVVKIKSALVHNVSGFVKSIEATTQIFLGLKRANAGNNTLQMSLQFRSQRRFFLFFLQTCPQSCQMYLLFWFIT